MDLARRGSADSGRPVPDCGYPLAGITAARCPECGGDVSLPAA